MKGLQVGKVVKAILSGMENVYPLVADKDTRFPFIVYRRVNMQCTGVTKDLMPYQTLSSVEVVVASDKYSEGIDVAQEVARRMMGARWRKCGDIEVCDVSLAGAEEEFTDNAFIQRLTFNIETL